VDSDIRVNVSPDLVLLVRVEVLAHIARDIAAAAGVDESNLTSILLGFREGFIKILELLAYDEQQHLVGYLRLEVNWDQFAVSLTRGSSQQDFRLDQKSPVSGQIAPLLNHVREYIAHCTAELSVVRVKPIYTFVPAKAERAREVLKTVPSKDNVLADLARGSKFDRELEVTDHELPELNVVYRHQLPASAVPPQLPGGATGDVPGS